jgi:hypothetical protein
MLMVETRSQSAQLEAFLVSNRVHNATGAVRRQCEAQ